MKVEVFEYYQSGHAETSNVSRAFSVGTRTSMA
jgi:hypothetical protein